MPSVNPSPVIPPRGERPAAPPTTRYREGAPAPEWRLRAALAELASILSGPSIQVRCLECPTTVAAATASGERSGLGEILVGWLSR